MTTQYTPEQLANINLHTIIESSQYTSAKMCDSLRATVSLLKTFDGNQNHLEAFINTIDTFHNRYYAGDESQKEFVNLAIQSKLIGEANNFILTRPDLITWPQIKEALRLKFSDPISRQNLTQQLMFSMKNRNESALDYVHKLKTLVHRIISKIQSEPLDTNTKLTLINQTELTATHNLMSNVPQDLKTILIIQNPSDLSTALNTITNYEMINNQLSFRHQISHPPMPFKPQPKPTTHSTPLQPPTNANVFAPRFQQNTSFPRQPIHVQPRWNQPQHFPTNRQVFGKPQNVFKPTNNSNFPKPTPMSGVSIQPRRPANFQNFGSRSGNQPFNHRQNNPHANPLIFQEITHLETPECIPEYNYSNLGNYPDYTLPTEYEDDFPVEYDTHDAAIQEITYEAGNDENFQTLASEHPHHV